MNKKIVIALLLSIILNVNAKNEVSFKDELSLKEAVSIAIQHDLWLKKSNYLEHGLTDKSTSAATLPDPMLSAAIVNLPTNGFEFNQEPMTQLKVGIAQLFPRGDTQELQKQRYLDLAAEQPSLRADRRAKTRLAVTKIWLTAFQAQASKAIIKDNKRLFEQLKEIASVNYSSLVGKGRQQDIIRAEVALSLLDDRLMQLNALGEASYTQLIEWLVDESGRPLVRFDHIYLPEFLPPITNFQKSTTQVLETKEMSVLAQLVNHHPLVKALDKQIEASHTSVSIAKQEYKPQWGVNASYAYRDNDPLGQSRADFFSLGVTLQIPLFSNKRQLSDVSFAIKQNEAKRTERQLLLRELIAGLTTAYANYSRLLERKNLYHSTIIPQIAQQSSLVLNAYTNDDGDFAEVTQVRISELDAKLALLNISIELRKNIALIEYYIAHKLHFSKASYE